MNKTISTLVVSLALLTGCANKAPQHEEGGDVVKVTQTARGAQLTSNERLLFDLGRAEIGPYGMVYIERVATILKSKTSANVVVEGHTDSTGNSTLNQQLSLARANAVKDALVKQGIRSERIQAQGFGMTKPIADNNTSEGRQINRRTEIIVLGETVEKLGGASLGDRLNEGFGNIVKSVKSLLGS